jgi:hypothetical protein
MWQSLICGIYIFIQIFVLSMLFYSCRCWGFHSPFQKNSMGAYTFLCRSLHISSTYHTRVNYSFTFMVVTFLPTFHPTLKKSYCVTFYPSVVTSWWIIYPIYYLYQNNETVPCAVMTWKLKLDRQLKIFSRDTCLEKVI